MLSFSTLLLRSYYAAIGWNEDNLYSNLTRSSAALIDFHVPDSLLLQLANAPTPIFFNAYALDALPQLNGSMSYITTSESLSIGPSRTMPFRDVVERFRVYPPPSRPVGKPELWMGGRRVEGRDFLFYSRLHLPTMHLSGLATMRLAPTVQAQLAFVHLPAGPRLSAPLRQQGNETPAPPPSLPPGNLLLSIQHDTGRYSGEYTYSASDGMFGARGLYNFAWHNGPTAAKDKRIDEEDMMDGGLRGRFSAGGEVYLSLRQRSLGVSTGVRFTTLPPSSAPGAPPASPPTTLTVLYNPLIGFLSTAYAAQVSPTVALATRFGVNVYSYESDFALGGEWWIGRRWGKKGPALEMSPEDKKWMEKKKRIGGALREDPGPDPEPEQAPAPAVVDVGTGHEPDPASVLADDGPARLPRTRLGRAADSTRSLPPPPPPDQRDGVLKARLSGNWSLALLYESRIRNCLVSVGLVSDLLSGTSGRAIRGVGIEVQYYS